MLAAVSASVNFVTDVQEEELMNKKVVSTPILDMLKDPAAGTADDRCADTWQHMRRLGSHRGV